MEEATTWRQWVKGVKKLRTLLTADADGDASGPNFGDDLTEVDYTRIPRLGLADKWRSTWGKVSLAQFRYDTGRVEEERKGTTGRTWPDAFRNSRGPATFRR
jgi:hypothetical protein